LTAPAQPQSVNINISATVDYLTDRVATLTRENAILIGQNAAMRAEAEQHAAAHATTTFDPADEAPGLLDADQPLEAVK
jgi:hypothetical protein